MNQPKMRSLKIGAVIGDIFVGEELISNLVFSESKDQPFLLTAIIEQVR